MAGTMPSEHLQLLIAGYVLGDLDPDEAIELERLMQTDPSIAEEIAEMQSTLEVSFSTPDVAPPAHLRTAVLARSDRAFPRRRLSISQMLNVAAAAAIAILGISNYRLWQTLQMSQTEVQRLATLNYSLQSAANQGSATLAVDPNRLEASLQVKGLPSLPPGKVYALWTVLEPTAPFTVDAKGAILTDVFQVDAQGNAVQTVSVPHVFRSKEFVTKVAITVEDAVSPQKHEGKPILITSL
jgi:anti-sigma-K factor RskA